MNPDGDERQDEHAAPDRRQPPAARRPDRAPGGRRRGDERQRDSSLAARKFLGRLAQLELEEMGAAIHQWRSSVGPGWFDAEVAVAAGMRDSGRFAEQEVWLEHIAAVFRKQPWFTSARPGAEIAASEAAAQYVSTTALLALLVRDHLGATEFETLYGPFAELIPVEELERE